MRRLLVLTLIVAVILLCGCARTTSIELPRNPDGTVRPLEPGEKLPKVSRPELNRQVTNETERLAKRRDAYVADVAATKERVKEADRDLTAQEVEIASYLELGSKVVRSLPLGDYAFLGVLATSVAYNVVQRSTNKKATKSLALATKAISELPPGQAIATATAVNARSKKAGVKKFLDTFVNNLNVNVLAKTQGA